MAKDTPKAEYSNLIPPFGSISYEMDFDNLYNEYFKQLSYIALRLIVFEDVPETIDEIFLKYSIMLLGKVVFFKLDQEILDQRQSAVHPLKPGDLVALNGNDSNMQTIYYMHNKVLVTNPVFSKTYNLTPGEDCEIVYCTEPDRYRIFGHGGLFGLIARTATILADNDISINVAQRNTRLVNLISADDTGTKRSVDKVMRDVYSGKPYMAVQSNLLGNLQSIPMTQTTSNQYLVQLIEMRQYIYSHFYECLGLQTHDNMKKERLITEEINDNEELSALNIDDILTSIQEGLQRVNAMFGTDIKAYLNPIIQRAHDQTEAAAEDVEDTIEEPAEDQTEEPAEDQTEEPAEDQTEEPAEDQTEEPAEDQTEEPAEDQAEEPIEDQAEEPIEDQTEEPAEDQTEEPAEDQTEEPAEDQQVQIEIHAEDQAEVQVEIQQEQAEDPPEDDPPKDPEEVKGDE
jgi:hypothetical protein